MSKKTTPHEFDMDAWLSGASRPTRSVTIYRDGALLADLDRLAEEIRVMEAADGEEPVEWSMTDPSPATLRHEYAELSERFHAGAVVVRVQSLSAAEQKRIRDGREASDMDGISRDLVHAAIVSPAMTREQFAALVDVIGGSQWKKLQAAYLLATSGDVEPSADFLPQSSTLDDGA